MEIGIDIKEKEYSIVLERGCIRRVKELIDTGRKCLIVTDDGVPAEYSAAVAAGCMESVPVTVPQGEASKNMAQLERLLTVMLNAGFTRSDCVIAAGGGMVGDLAGFAASIYMRGIDFYNIPTTVLSQADSSIGGKTAIDLGGAKNIAGTFWQPRKVLIDPDLTASLPAAQKLSGLAEIIKAGMIADAQLFEYIEGMCAEPRSEAALSRLDIDSMLEASLLVKKAVVEKDERESGLRRILNFGHTIGHGIESVTGMLHGHCVALGMIPMCSPELRVRLTHVLEALGLPVRTEADAASIYEAMLSDKKMKEGMIAAVYVDEPGSAYIRMTSPEELRERIGITAK